MSEAEDQVLTLERKMGPEMDLVNRPNPWLPAYGFQIQPLHANFPNTHEDLRANEAMLAQQVDFLETILEETSDDLQSDSDRSGTTYWLGSDSETESVIHIKAGQRNADEKQDGSGSECNSVVPKKRRRRNNSSSDLLNPGAASPRSSRDSSTSSRSSSLLQFESLERTCATLSPSSYSFDSLEYSSSGRGTTSGRLSRTVDASNGASSRHEACASPDSLEHEDYGQINGYYNESHRDPGSDGLFRLRPYRSFESLGEKDMMMQDRNGHLGGLLSNGFSAHAFGKNCDLSRLARRPNSRRRDPWQHVYSDYDESTNDSPENLSSEEEDEREEDDEEDYTSCRYTEVDQLLVFGDPSSTYSHAASLDCRNSVDLRDFGLDSDDERTRRETTFLDLKAAARLSLPTSNSQQQQQQSSEEEDVDLEGIDPSVQLRRRHHHHHHHHHHHRSSGGGGGGGGGGSLQYNNSGGSGGDNSDARQSGAGNASGGGFNFRFTDKWRSAPSLPGSLLDDVAAAKSSSFVAAATVVSNRSTYEAYTRVASVPVDLDLCGRSSRALIIDDRIDDDVQELEAEDLKSSEEVNKTVQTLQEDQVKEEQEEKESSMSEIVTMNHDGPVLVPEGDLEPGKVVGEEKARLRKRAKEQLSAGIKTQDKVNLALSSEMLNSLGSPKNASLDNDDVDQLRKSPVLQTVKTQDKVESNEVLEIALAMEKDVDAVVDEAIRQLKREVEEATSQNAANVEELTAALESARRARLENLQERRRVKNNASYELAQQNMVDELSIRRRKLYHRGIEEEPPRPRRVVNNASYELAQQADVMKHLPIDRRFFRMNACEEHPEPSSSSVTDLVVEMSATGSSYNLSSEYHAPASSSRQYSKSSENVSNNARQQAKQQKKEETSLLDQIKKNSDFFSTSGEDAGKASPATVLPALDDEVDYPCLLENKPIIVAHSMTDKTTIKNLENDVETTREIVTEEEDSDGLQKKSFIGEFYRAATPKNALVSKSCEEVWSNGTLRNAPADRLWGVVMEARASAAEKEKSSGGGTTPPLLASPSRSPESAARYTGSTAAGSSPAAAAERDNAIVNIPVPTTTTPVDEEASTVQPRPNAEMSATAAKRLAMSGQPTTVKSPSSTSVNTLSTTTSKEERKKGGLGGFLQRFSKLRFSGRSKVPRSEVQKKSGASGVTVEHAVQNNSTSRLQQATPSKKKNEPDYIIIPLHAPEDELRKNEEEQQLQQQQETNDKSAPNISANGRPPACGHKKPPLPPQSLRSGGPGGSGGGGGGGGSSYGFGGVGVPAAPSRRRAATDLGNPAAIEMAKARAAMLAASSSSTVSQEPSSSQQRYFQQQRPVGLLETDLDAPEDEEASKKARSLLNLNGHPHPQLSIAPQHLDYSLVDEDAAAQATAAGAAAGNHLSHRHHHHNGQNHHHHHHRGKAASEAAAGHQRPHKSMEFLLDKENLHFVKPPENELQKVGERVPSEHELRVQRSLQRLNVPDWYKNSPAARDGGGFRLKRHSDASQHGGWRALGSKTTSLSSLSSSSNRQPTAGTLLSPSPTPPVFSRWSTSLLNSAGSSPASSARSSFNHRQPYLGWRSQERLSNPRTPAERLAQGILPQLQNANKQQQQLQSPPSPQSTQQSTHQQSGPQTGTTTNQEVRNSIKEVTSAIVHYVQSGQEVVGGGGGRLSPRPDDLSRGGSRSTSPRGSTRLVWMESSFVGVRPVELPDTPAGIAVPQHQQQASPSRSSLLDVTLTSTTLRSAGGETSEDGGGSTPGVYPDDGAFMSLSGGSSSLFLDLQEKQQQLLQQSSPVEAMLPQDHRHRQRRHHRRPDEQRRESPSPTQQAQPQQHQSRHRHRAEPEQHQHRHHQQQPHQRAESAEPQRAQSQQRSRPPLTRRRSEGSDSTPPARSGSRTGHQQQQQHHHHHHHQQHKHQQHHRQRRVSFDGASSSLESVANRDDRVVRCRNSKCTNSASLAEARRSFKSCHNCTCLYCSRECRRAHWQRHRRTCLYSRASSLCIQVLSSVKKDPTSLKHVSVLAKRGFAAHGRGAVKCFFASPEAAEKFIQVGFMELGEPTYVRWSDILPSEMGAELYAEAVRLCESYNPESRLVLYVSVCVVREVPSSSGAVMWERQPVSRCAKLRLEVTCREHHQANTSSSTSAITSPQQTRGSPTNITRDMDSPETLVFVSYPPKDGAAVPRNVREQGFGNIQKILKQRGVSLRRNFPTVFGKLSAYVEGTNEKFAPVTIYPKDPATGRNFMCIIMLDASPDKLNLLPTDSSKLKTVDVNVNVE